MRTLYSNPNKDEKEGSFFETFCSVREDLHIQNPRRGIPPEPDYIFDLSQKKIGLEVTSPVKELLAKIRTAQDECLQEAAQISERIGLETVNVQVEFRSDRSRINKSEAVKELVEFVKEKTPEIDDKKSWRYNQTGLKYSKEIIIRLGTLNGHTWLTNYRFKRIYKNWMRNPIGEIQAQIDKKQPKYPKYIQSCDECWLLIGVNELTAPEALAITEGLDSHVFSGDFQRLFFLRNIERNVKELKINHK